METPSWTKPFILTTSDGIVYHGAEFPSGRIVLDHSYNGLVCASDSLESLLLSPDMEDAVVHWLD